MSSFSHHSQIGGVSLALSMFWLASCSEQSEQAQVPHSEQVQDPRCKQVTGLFAIADWETLATGPFVETSRSDDGVDTLAPAKSLIAGFKDCRLWRQKFPKTRTGLEFFHYICEAPAPPAYSGDLVGATKSIAAEWRSCFVGWQEMFKIYKDPNRDRPTASFTKNDDEVSFSSTRNYQTVMNSIWITKTMRKLPLRMPGARDDAQ